VTNGLPFRVGLGEDAHRLEEGRRLVVAGVEVPGSPRGALAHSDGDVVLHAVSDALLSTLSLGDIGHYFPDTDPQHAGLDSRRILETTLARVHDAGYAVANVAVVVTLDRPKLGPLRAEMQRTLAGLLGLPESDAAIGFKTSEGLAPDHVQARATVLLTRP